MPRLIIKQPKWVQDIINSQRNTIETLNRNYAKACDLNVKKSEEIQYLLDIVRNIRPDIFDAWNTGTGMDELLEMSKKPALLCKGD